MKVLISVDMEGVAGVVDPDDIRPGTPEWSRNRVLLTEEANAAVRGVFAVDADATVVVCDAHARYRNLLPERLDRRCTLIRGTPRRHDMLPTIDTGVSAVCMIGYHGRAGTARSVLAHTLSGGTVAAVRCNGEPVGEIALNALLAAHHGAIPVAVSGDDTATAEAAAAVPGIAVATVKWALGNRAAESLHPDRAGELIEQTVGQGLRDRSAVRAPRVEGPVDLEIDLLRPHMTERARLIPGIESRGPLTLGYRADDLPTAYGLVGLIADLAGLD